MQGVLLVRIPLCYCKAPKALKLPQCVNPFVVLEGRRKMFQSAILMLGVPLFELVLCNGRFFAVVLLLLWLLWLLSWLLGAG